MQKVVLFTLFSTFSLSMGLPKSYYKIKTIKEQKQVFFDTLYPMIKHANKKVLKDRDFIKRYFHSGLFGFRQDGLALIELLKIRKRYNIKDLYDYEQYLLQVDIVPVSIVLAQAALESGWGKSRFIKQANNIFGQWTWTGKGLVPKSRDEGAKHKIKIFNSLEDSISGYLINLNKGWAYEDFRKQRNFLRSNNLKLEGLKLYKTLINYSQLKEEYTRRLKHMIIKNNLEKYD